MSLSPFYLQTFQYLLEAAGTQTTYLQGRKPPPKNSKKISNFVIDNLEQKYKKLGTNSSVYTTEQKYFEDLITKTFYNLMVCIFTLQYLLFVSCHRLAVFIMNQLFFMYFLYNYSIMYVKWMAHMQKKKVVGKQFISKI